MLAWEKTDWYHTPTQAFGDFMALRSLPAVELQVASRTETAGDEGLVQVSVENPTERLAFFVRLRITRGESGAEVLPVLWEDNYFELLPREKRNIKATFRTKDLHGAAPAVKVDGWNVTAKAR